MVSLSVGAEPVGLRVEACRAFSCLGCVSDTGFVRLQVPPSPNPQELHSLVEHRAEAPAFSLAVPDDLRVKDICPVLPLI